MRGIALVFLLCAAGCTTTAPTARDSAPAAAMRDDAARPVRATGWIRSELYFGLGRDGETVPAVSAGQWRTFLDREVTPRFPDGFSVIDAYGQWLARGESRPERLTSKVIVILHADTPQRRADIDAIRAAWKRETRDESVLWSQQLVTVSF